jgi:hypothetical protein
MNIVVNYKYVCYWDVNIVCTFLYVFISSNKGWGSISQSVVKK